MKENYIKMINAVLPNELINSISEKTGINKQNVEYVCAETLAKIFGNGENLRKSFIVENVKKASTGEVLKEILTKVDAKYNIAASDAGVVLSSALPIIQKKVANLDNSYFEPEELILEKASVDDIYKNIEIKAEEQIKPKANLISSIKNKFNAPRPKIEEKSKTEEKISEPKTVKMEQTNVNLIEKICMYVVLAAFVCVILTFVVLIIKSKISAT